MYDLLQMYNYLVARALKTEKYNALNRHYFILWHWRWLAFLVCSNNIWEVYIVIHSCANCSSQISACLRWTSTANKHKVNFLGTEKCGLKRWSYTVNYRVDLHQCGVIPCFWRLPTITEKRDIIKCYREKVYILSWNWEIIFCGCASILGQEAG